MREEVLLAVALTVLALGYGLCRVAAEPEPRVCDWCHGTRTQLAPHVVDGVVLPGRENCWKCGGDGVL